MVSQLSEREQFALEKSRTAFQKALGSDLVEMKLFGSKVRGDAREDSDLDVLVVKAGDDWRTCDLVYGTATDILLETDVCISPKVISKKEYEHLYDMRTPFISNIVREGITI